MITVDNDNQLLIQEGGWEDGDADTINQYPTYKVRGNYFPLDFVVTSSRVMYKTQEYVTEQYVGDDGTVIITTYTVTVWWLTEVQESEI